MPETKGDLTETLQFLHALWSNSEINVPKRFSLLLENGGAVAAPFAAYRAACRTKDDPRAETELAKVRDALLNAVPQQS